MNKNTIIVAFMVITAGIGGYLLNSVANTKTYGYSNMQNGTRKGFAEKASILSMSVEELNKLRGEGKTMGEIAELKGMTKDVFFQRVQNAAINRWKAQGLIETEISTRLADMKSHQTNCTGEPQNYGGRGNGMGRNR